jgi:hypothetical protein
MLGEAGFEAYAPDWPGHGESDKPSSSSFSYSQKAYLDGLTAFVEAVGIKKPFALVVQVREMLCDVQPVVWCLCAAAWPVIQQC